MIQRNFTRPLKAWALFAALVCAFSFAAPARAQGDQLEPSLLRSPQLTPDQKKRVEAYVSAHSKQLSGKAEGISKDRAALLEPLRGTGAATPFRLEYSGLLVDPVLMPLLASENELVVVNAVVIAGDLATQRSVDLLKEAASSAKPAVRYEASYGLRRTFEALSSMEAPSIQSDQVDAAIDFIGGRIGKEGDAIVVDGLVRAALEAAKLPRHRSRALSVLSKEVSARCRALSPADAPDALLQSMLRAGIGARDTLAGPRGQIDVATLSSVAKLGGQLVALAVRAVELRATQSGGVDRRDRLADIAGAGETLALLALNLQGSRPPETKRFDESIKTAEAQFLVDAKDFLGARGPLVGEPFKIPAAEFPLK